MKKEFAFEWKKITDAWSLALPPARPAPGDVNVYRNAIKKELKKKNKLKILILGSTPELRILVSEFSSKTDLLCCDINIEMFLAMTTLIKKLHPREEFLKSDWVTSPLKEGYFDIIMGDGVITNIPHNLYDDFFKHLKNLLVRGGLFVTRNPFLPAKRSYKNIDDVLNDFERQGKTFSAESELYMSIVNFTSHYHDSSCSMQKCREVLLKYYDKKSKKYIHPSKYINKLLNGKFLFNSLMSNKEWTYFSENKNEKIMSSYFKIEQKLFNKEWNNSSMSKMFGDFLAIYYLRNN